MSICTVKSSAVAVLSRSWELVSVVQSGWFTHLSQPITGMFAGKAPIFYKSKLGTKFQNNDYIGSVAQKGKKQKFAEKK